MKIDSLNVQAQSHSSYLSRQSSLFMRKNAIAAVLMLPLCTSAIAATTIQPAAAHVNGNAMTWVVKQTYTSSNGKTYALFGSDHSQNPPLPGQTNPYNGDTSIKQRRSLLCVRPLPANANQAPADLPPSNIAPGGAHVNSWSKKAVMVIPNVMGGSLLSKADADNKCKQVGQIVHGVSGFRMAEFHDGTPGSSGQTPGWSFWAEAFTGIQGLDLQGRYWISINDQNSNPW